VWLIHASVSSSSSSFCIIEDKDTARGVSPSDHPTLFCCFLSIFFVFQGYEYKQEEPVTFFRAN